MASKGWLGLLPYICIGIIWVSKQKKENQESAKYFGNDLSWAIKSYMNKNKWVLLGKIVYLVLYGKTPGNPNIWHKLQNLD